MNLDKDKDIKKLKFKYSEYLIGDKKSFHQIKEYVANKFDLIETDNKNITFNLIDRFLRQNFYYSYRNSNLEFSEDQLNLSYYIIDNNIKSKDYYSLTNPNNYPLYIVFEEKTKAFDTNSSLLLYELDLYEGIDENDIKNNTSRLKHYLLLLEEEEILKKLKEINPKFITPEDKKIMLENYIINELSKLSK